MLTINYSFLLFKLFTCLIIIDLMGIEPRLQDSKVKSCMLSVFTIQTIGKKSKAMVLATLCLTKPTKPPSQAAFYRKYSEIYFTKEVTSQFYCFTSNK